MEKSSTIRSEAGTLALLITIAAAFFVLTGFAVSRYHAKEKQLGREWHARGQSRLAQQPNEAVQAFQTALRYDPGEPQYRLGLVQALLAAGRSEQARSYLLAMWEQQPADGIVNLNLARIAASRGDVPQTIRYYHNAIYAVWDDAPQVHRLQARFELTDFLLKRGAVRETDAELVAIAANNPSTPDLARRLGNLFLRVNDPDSALQQFREVLKTAPRDPEALAGAGKAAFALRNYADARTYLRRASDAGATDATALAELQLAESIRDNDPLDHKVAWPIRAERATRALLQARLRLGSCADSMASTARPVPAPIQQRLQDLDTYSRQATPRNFRQDPDLLTTVAGEAFAAEELATRYCGPPQGLDQALLLIGRSHPEVTP